MSLVYARLITDTPVTPHLPAVPTPPPAATLQGVPHPSPAPVSAPTKTTPSSPPLPTSTTPSGYLPIEDVDQPATPLGDWDIDPDLLPRNTSLQVKLQLWISAQGTIDQWDLLEASLTDAGLVDKILSNLQHTRLQPALLNHVAVPSVRRLELSISRE